MHKYTIGLDWGKRHSIVCVLNDLGEQIHRGSIPCGGKGIYVLAQMLGFKSGEAFLVSEVGPGSTSVQEVCDELGVKHHAVHASHMALIVKTKRKTDRIDARKLAQQGFKDNLPRAVRIPTREESKRRFCLYQREKLINHRVQFLNEIRWTYYNNVQVYRGEGELKKSQMVSKSRREQMINDFHDPLIRSAVMTRFKAIDEINEMIKTLEKTMEEKADKERLKRLQTIPGVGPIVAHTYCAVIGDVSRFDHVKAVVSFAGLDPGISQSGKKSIGLRITKEGNKYLRSALVQAAQCLLINGKPGDPLLNYYTRQRARKKNHNKVVIALAAKILRIMYAVDLKRANYDAEKVKQNKEKAA